MESIARALSFRSSFRTIEIPNRPLAAFLSAQALTTFTSELMRVAIPITLFLATGNSTTVAYAAAVTLLPRVLLSAPAGVLVDRIGVRLSLISADVIQGLGALAIVAAHGASSPLPILFALLFAINGAATLKLAAIPTAVGDLTRPTRLTNVYGALWTFESLAATLAPLAAAFLVGRGGLQAVGTVYAVAALASVTLLAPVAFPAHERAAGSSVTKDLREAGSLLWHRRELLLFALFGTFVNFTFTIAFVMFTPMILLSAGNNAYGPARVLMWGGIAQLVSAAALGLARAPRRPVRAMILCTGLMAAGPLVIGVSSSVTVWTIAYAATMALLPFAGSWERPVWLVLVEKQYRGRVFGLRRTIVAALLPVASMLSAGAVKTGEVLHVAPLVSHRLLFAAAGAGLLALAAVGYSSRRLRSLDDQYEAVCAESGDAVCPVAENQRRRGARRDLVAAFHRRWRGRGVVDPSGAHRVDRRRAPRVDATGVVSERRHRSADASGRMSVLVDRRRVVRRADGVE